MIETGSASTPGPPSAIVCFTLSSLPSTSMKTLKTGGARRTGAAVSNHLLDLVELAVHGSLEELAVHLLLLLFLLPIFSLQASTHHSEAEHARARGRARTQNCEAEQAQVQEGERATEHEQEREQKHGRKNKSDGKRQSEGNRGGLAPRPPRPAQEQEPEPWPERA